MPIGFKDSKSGPQVYAGGMPGLAICHERKKQLQTGWSLSSHIAIIFIKK